MVLIDEIYHDSWQPLLAMQQRFLEMAVNSVADNTWCSFFEPFLYDEQIWERYYFC